MELLMRQPTMRRANTFDDRGHVLPALIGGDLREVRCPELDGPVCLELSVHPVQRTWQSPVSDGGAYHLAMARAPQARKPREALHHAACCSNAFAIELVPELVGAVDLHVGLPHLADLRQQGCIVFGTRTT